MTGRGAGDVIVVIPVYRQMNPFERVALEQCVRVLHRYPLAIIAGQSMQLDDFLAYHPFQIERFSDEAFGSTQSYSRLLLSQAFYERFSAFSYLLIYQLDAFVFSDRLQEFCRQGYDYIGAPVPRWGWKGVKNRVGNGGFSLRRIASCQRVLHEFPPEHFFSLRDYGDDPEDAYFAGCAEVGRLHFRVPTVREALEFSVDFDLFHCYRWMPEWLPFGCHAWNAIDYWHWRPILERYGYELPEPQGTAATEERRRVLERYLAERLLRPTASKDILFVVLASIFPSARLLALWGWGTYGRLAFDLVQAGSREIAWIFDKRKSAEDEGMPIMMPDVESVQNAQGFILVTTLDYEDEICEELRRAGMKEGIGYGRISKFLRKLAETYLKSFQR